MRGLRDFFIAVFIAVCVGMAGMAAAEYALQDDTVVNAIVEKIPLPLEQLTGQESGGVPALSEQSDAAELAGDGGQTSAAAPETTAPDSAADLSQPEQEVQGSETEDAASPADAREAAQDPETAEAMRISREYYAFGLLNEVQQVDYGQILSGLLNMEPVTLVTTDPEEMDRIYNYVMADHPEIFYIRGYSYVKHLLDDQIVAIDFEGTYTHDQDSIATSWDAIDAYTNTVLGQMPEGLDDYGIARYLYEYIVLHTEYDWNAPDNQEMISVMEHGASVCNGYAKAYQFLMNECGIPTTYVYGTSRGEGHAWDLALLDGDYYYIDPTWGDAQFSDPSDARADWVNYSYLGLTTDDLLRNHRISADVPMPPCTKTADNYYRREGKWFDAYDPERFATLMQEAKDGNGVVTYRCSSEETFNEMKDILFDQQKIYEFLPGLTRVSYSEDQEMNTMFIFLR